MEELLKKFGKKILIFAAPWILIILVVLFVVSNMLEAFQGLTNALEGAVSWAKDAGESVFSTFWNNDKSEPEWEVDEMDKWNGSEDTGDPEDKNWTATVYTAMKKNHDRLEAGTEAATAAEEAWDQFNSADHTMIGSSDIRKLIKHSYDENNKMFQKRDIYYHFKKWSLNPKNDETGTFLGWMWEADTPLNATSNKENPDIDDKRLGKVTRSKIEGEKASPNYETDDRKFAKNWQDYVALAGLISFEKGRNVGDKLSGGFDGNSRWGESSESAYNNGNDADPSDKNAAQANSTDNYFLVKKDFDNIYDLFDYKFEYKWDGVKDTAHDSEGEAYQFDLEKGTLLNTGNIGYHYQYMPDPEPQYELMVEKPADYGDNPNPETRYIPDSAPLRISNGYSSYEYVYVPTGLVNASTAGWDGSDPPNGEYCIGRWEVENPAALILQIAAACGDKKNGKWRSCGYYEELSGDKNWSENHHTKPGEDGRETDADGNTLNYDWETEMMDLFCTYLSTLEVGQDSTSGKVTSRGTESINRGDTSSDGIIPSREEYFRQMLEKYKGSAEEGGIVRKITIDYRGAYDDIIYSYDDMIAYAGNDGATYDDAEGLARRELDKVYDLYKDHFLRVMVNEKDMDYDEKVEKAEELAEVEVKKWTVEVTYNGEKGYNPETAEQARVYRDDSEREEHQWANNQGYCESYGVIYGNPSEEPGGDYPEDSDSEGYEPSGQIENGGRFWIYTSPDGSYVVDDWYYYYDKANTDISSSGNYTKEEIRSMLEYINGKSSKANTFNFARDEFVNALYDYQQSGGPDIAAALAILVVEGGYSSRHGLDHYNFYDFTASGGESTYAGSHPWWDAKTDCDGDPGRALVAGIKKMQNNYYNRGQKTFLTMCFNQYVLGVNGGAGPQNHTEAVDATSSPGYSHCYCPWWESAYVPDFIWQNDWPNKCAMEWMRILGKAGRGGGSVAPPTATNYDPTNYINSPEFRQILASNPKLAALWNVIEGNNSYGKNLLGTPYGRARNGEQTTGPNSFDCSGFTWYVYTQAGYGGAYGGRGSAEGLRQKLGENWKRDGEPQPGDVVFFEKTQQKRGATHIGIYLGNGIMIHSGSSKGVSLVNYTTSDYHSKRYYGYGRIG